MSTLLTKKASLQPQQQPSDSQLRFWKMHGAGNDFVVLDALTDPLPAHFDFARAAQVLCARHFGVGSDGLLLLERPSTSEAEIRMRMWNPDGSEDMCGNGLRCIAQLAHDLHHLQQKEFTVQTLAGLRQCKVLGPQQVRIEMGTPLLGFQEIPMRPLKNSQSAIEYSLPVGKRVFENVTSLSTGSTHTVIFLDEELSEREFQEFSPQIENHEYFPERTSVLWAYLVDESTLRVRIWERGAGETLACGTGACAVAVAAQLTDRAQGTIAVQSKGGTLQIDWDSTKKGQSIFMTGPTQTVFQGVFLRDSG